MHDVHSYNQTIPITIIQDGKVLATLRALVDTGALQGNYMSEHAYSKLNGCGFEHNNINIRVCAAFNDCVISTDSLTLTLQFNYNLINLEHFEASLAFNVLNNIQYDLIIGRPSILKYGIWHRTLQPSVISTVNTIHENVASNLQTIDTIQVKTLVASKLVDSVHTRPLMVEADCRDSKRLTQAEAIPNSTVLSPFASRRNAQRLKKRRQSKPCQHVNPVSRKETCRSNCSLESVEDILRISQQVATLSKPLPLVCAGLTTPNVELISVNAAEHSPMSVEISSNDESRLT